MCCVSRCRGDAVVWCVGLGGVEFGFRWGFLLLFWWVGGCECCMGGCVVCGFWHCSSVLVSWCVYVLGRCVSGWGLEVVLVYVCIGGFGLGSWCYLGVIVFM